MAQGFSNWFLILYLVLLTLCSCGNGVREISNKQQQSLHENHHMHAHLDASTIGFFGLNDLFPGNTMLIDFTQYMKSDPSSSPPFLSREEADSIPFSSTQLPNLLEYFSIPPGSPQAKTMKETLRKCESRPVKGEARSCLTSLESMLDFIRGILGSETPIKVLTTQLPNSFKLFQNFTILEVPEEVPFKRTAACHDITYPYAVFYCHSPEKGVKVFKISLGGEDGSKVEAVANCHMDTFAWEADHIAFRRPGVKPGTPVCHFFVGDNLLWVSAPSAVTGY